MSHNFRDYDQAQLFLMPPSVQEWVKQDSLARFLSEVIDGMDARGRLDAFYAPYRVDGWGAAAFHPVMMLKVVLYAYTNGVTSSRRIEAMLEVDIAFRYLAANNQPDFRTINGFRTTHLDALLGVFVDVLELCREAGMVKLGRVALDGHRVAGDASLSENRKRERLEQQVQELPVIVAQQLTNEQADVGLLASMLDLCEEQAGARPAQVLADAGYWSEANGALDGQDGTDLLIATVHWPQEDPEKHPQRDLMEEKLEKEEGKAAYAQRGSTVEPSFGQMVTRGLERFRLRGKKKVGLEWSLWCTTHNLLKLWRHFKRTAGHSAPCTAAPAA